MEVIDLGRLGLNPRKQTTLEMAQDLQRGLLPLDGNAKAAMGYEAIMMMGDPDTLDGLKNIYLHAMGALVLTEGLVNASAFEEIPAGNGKYAGEFYLKAYFQRFAYVGFQSLDSICLRLVRPEIVNADISDTDIDPKKLQGHFAYIPVSAVETVWAA